MYNSQAVEITAWLSYATRSRSSIDQAASQIRSPSRGRDSRHSCRYRTSRVRLLATHRRRRHASRSCGMACDGTSRCHPLDNRPILVQVVLFSSRCRGIAFGRVALIRLVLTPRIHLDRFFDSDRAHGGLGLSIQQGHQNPCDRPNRSLISPRVFFRLVAAAFSNEPKISALVFSGFGDLVLWLQWHVIRRPRVRTRQREQVRLELSSRLLTTELLYAPTASCPPSGRKYCVPLIGSVTFRKSSCRSSLRSTKSISDVFTISRSDDV